jgi:hypothetical protein
MRTEAEYTLQTILFLSFRRLRLGYSWGVPIPVHKMQVLYRCESDLSGLLEVPSSMPRNAVPNRDW